MRTKRTMILAESKGLLKSLWCAWQGAVKDAQTEKKCCYHCSSLDLFYPYLSTHKDFEGKYTVKWQGGDSIEERILDPSDNSQHTKEPPDRGSQGIKPPQQNPILNPDPFQHWHGVKNIARVRINGESCMALLDNGTQINTIMPKYVSDHSLQMGPITNLLWAKVSCIGLGNAYMRPFGYVIIQVSSRWSSGL